MERTARTFVWIVVWSLTALVAGRAAAQDWAREMFDPDNKGLTSHDFGTVARGAKVEYRFPVENIYLEDAHIKSATASCGCTTVEVPTQILKTWKKAYLLVKIDTERFDGQRDVTIDVEFDKPFRAITQLNIHCFIRTDVVLMPGSVHLRTAQGTAAQQRVSVRYAGKSDWQIERVESANPHITGKVIEVSRGDGMVNYDLTVELLGDTAVGYLRDELNLVTNDPNPRAQRVPVPVEAVVVEKVTVHPSPMIMDPVAVGNLANPIVRPLVVVSAKPFQITAVESTNPRFRCDLPTGEAAATIHRLPVAFLGGDTPGKVSTRIRIHTTVAAEPIEAEVGINLIRSEDAAAAAGKGPAEGNAEKGKPEDGAVDPVFGPPTSSGQSGPPGTADKTRTSSRAAF